MSPDDFFVGYLPTPPKLRRFLFAAAAVGFVAAIGLAFTLATVERNPGDGRWSTIATDIEGTYLARPYPMIAIDDAHAVLLVMQGKFGADDAGINGRRVRARGTVLRRGTLSLLELEGPLNDLGAGDSFAPTVASMATLTGEIIDPKCFAGAMKPGDGKTHKACAALCIRGGIPPALIDASGDCYILAGSTGGPLTGESLEFVAQHAAENVTISGEIREICGIRFFQTN